MMELKELFMYVRKELRCADKYAGEAVKHKQEYPALADAYHRIATDKVAHADMLHKQAHELAMKHHAEDVWDVEDYMVRDDMAHVRKCLEAFR